METYFKDEGGKKNCLIAVIKVQNLRQDRAEVKFDSTKVVPTLATICYESGEQVEQKHQHILKLVNENGSHTFNVPANGTEKKLLFRIDKVSRRFDRRKFSIRFSAQKHAGDDYDFSRLAEVRTTAIEVFSKRKVKDIDPQDASSKKRRRLHTAKASDLDEMKAKYAKLFQEIRMTLEQQQKQIDNLVNMLKSRNITRGNVMAPPSSGISGAIALARPPRLVGLEGYSDSAVAFNFGPPTPIDMPALA